VADAVTVAYLHSDHTAYSFHESLIGMVMYDQGEHLGGGYISLRCEPLGIVEGRNKCVSMFLEKDAEWLLWLDDDMGFEPNTLERLLAVADEDDTPIVGALCFANKHVGPDGLGGYRTAARPTIFDWAEIDGKQKMAGRTGYPINALTRCDGTGCACILIHRTVFEKMRDEYGDTWYDRIPNNDEGYNSEDISFCYRAGALGIPVHVHTGVKTNHLKNVWVGEPDYWAQVVPAIATEHTAVLVPVLNRPQNAEPFMRSLRASTGLAAAYVIVENDDEETATAWETAGAHVVIRDNAHTFAEKINVGYQLSDEPWLFIVGDDVRFHAGWLDHAQHIAKATGAQVIGTNDLGNPRVTRGEHATHMLIARAYVDEQGASWDGPKSVCHEGYRHWYVDDEIVTAAKQRGVWGMALASKVEHLHPAWGKGANDDVYKLGQVHADEDAKLFKQRLKASTR